MPILLALVLVILALGAGGACLAVGAARTPKTGISQPAGADEEADRDTIRKQLRALSKSAPPKNLSMGAMCYEMTMPPNRAEFVCGVCSNKTLYAAPEGEHGNETTRFLDWELEACRRIAGEIPGLDIQLDERLFCTHCSPDASEKSLAVVIKYSSDGIRHRVEDITFEDLRLLKEFCEGSKVHRDRQDFEKPLNDYLPRLQQLLGVSLDG